jgi:hypothetical protein
MTNVTRTPRSVAALLLSIGIVAGCASSGPIPMGNDTFMISQTSAGGMFTSMSSLKAEVMTQANAFAEGKGKVAIPIAARETPAVPGRMPSFEYQFRLVSKNDPRASGGSLEPRADVVIERRDDIRVKDVSARPKDVYAELVKLDDLRKRGIISEAEFEAQKQKLLAGN